MRLSRLHPSVEQSAGDLMQGRRTSRRVQMLLKVSASVCLLGLVAGCETKGWLDPKEVGRFKHEPLVMPVLKTIDPGVEENNPEYASATDPRAEDRVTSNVEYHISPNDLISVEITDLMGPGQATVKQTRVTESGKISLPYLGAIEAAGLTEFELEQAVSEGYRTANLITSAQVSVNVVEARGRSFEVLGAVQRPNIYAIPEANFRVIDALVLGGDVTSPLIDYIYIIRRVESDQPRSRPTTRPANGAVPTTAPTSAPGVDDLIPKTQAPPPAPALDPASTAQSASADRALNLLAEAVPAGSTATANSGMSVQLAQATEPEPYRTTGGTGGGAAAAQGATPTPSGQFEFNAPSTSGNTRVIRIPYQALHNGDLSYNITIRPHDVIMVQQLQTGVYYVAGHVARPGVFTLTGQRITIKQAIMGAGMFDELAIPQRTQIIRHIRPDQEVAMRIDLTRIFSMEQPDVYLKPDDQILVGTNAVAPFVAALRGAFRITYGFGFLFDRNFAYRNNNGSGF